MGHATSVQWVTFVVGQVSVLRQSLDYVTVMRNIDP